jgi:hypothetical protein
MVICLLHDAPVFFWSHRQSVLSISSLSLALYSGWLRFTVTMGWVNEWILLCAFSSLQLTLNILIQFFRYRSGILEMVGESRQICLAEFF